MSRHATLLTLILSTTIFLSSCQLDAETSWPIVIARQTDTPTPTPTLPATPTFAPTPTPTLTPTSTTTPTPTPTPTNTATPTPTPIPGDRLDLAQRAYTNGDYQTARLEFTSLLTDPGADPGEKRLALHWRGRSELQMGDTAAAIATFKMFLRQYPTDELARAAQFNLGQVYEQSGQPQAAIDAYLGSIIPNDPVNVYIYERIGDTRLRTGAYTETIAAYQAGIDSTDDIGFEVHLHEGIAQVELLHDNPAAAIAQYEAILDVAKIESYRAKILRLLGDAYMAIGDSETAYAHYLDAVNHYPKAHDSYLALIELINADVPVDDFQRGLVDYYAAAYQPAITAFGRYLAQLSAPPSEEEPEEEPPVKPFAKLITSTATMTTAALANDETLSPISPRSRSPDRTVEAIWLMGLSWKALGQYNSAILYFQKLIDNYPDSLHWGEAHLEIGKALIDQGNHSRARVFLRDFAAKNPDHSLAPEALWRAARLDLNDELFDEANTHLHTLVDTHPNSEYAVDALFWAGQSSYKLQNYQAAIEDWTTLADEYPTSDLISFAGYWRARALSELGKEEEAKVVLAQLVDGPVDYYSLRARDRLTGDQPGPNLLNVPTSTQLANERAEAETWLVQWLGLARTDDLSAIKVQVQSDPAFQRGDTLLDLGLRDEALAEFETIKEDRWDNALAMYQLSVYFREQGLGRLSIITAARLIFLSPTQTLEDTPIFIQRLYYPLYFEDTIFTEAEKFELDPALVAAIIRQESLFEPSAHSNAGARGLMQVIPTTGEYVAERGDFSDFNADQLWLPYLNIKFGAWYINQQLGIFDGNLFAALAAYNAGPGNVLEWVKVSDDLDIFVESIPFWESRYYVRTVYVNLAAYRRIYGIPVRN